MTTSPPSLTVAQEEFARSHAVAQVKPSFAPDHAVFMYSAEGAYTDRWLVLSDGSPFEHEHFERSASSAT